MRMLSKIVFAVATVLAATAPAMAEEGAAKERFVHEGYTYVYEVKPTKDGQLISGARYPGGSSFALKVKGEKVRGLSGGQNVAFKVAEAKGAAAAR